MSNVTVVSLIGAVDNLHEPMPIANHRGTILGVVLALMVGRTGSPALRLDLLPADWSETGQAVSLLCNVARLYVRFFVIYAPGWDDYFLMLYMVRLCRREALPVDYCSYDCPAIDYIWVNMHVSL